jgi:hypothetical protein
MADVGGFPTANIALTRIAANTFSLIIRRASALAREFPAAITTILLAITRCDSKANKVD